MAKKDTSPGQISFPGDGNRPDPVPVKMRRDPVFGDPTTADVHPDEVANWQEHGWEIDE
jgi:hypothetical protein